MAAFELAPSLSMRTSAGLVQYAEVLALSGTDLDAWVDAALERCPALEVPCPRTCARCGATVWHAGGHACLGGGARQPVPVADVDVRVEEALAEVAARLGQPARAAAAYLLGDLDHRGRLDRPLADVAAGAGCPLDLVHAALVVLRGVLGAGLAARDLRESLLLQLAEHGAAPELGSRLVRDCFEQVVSGRVAEAAAACGVPEPEVREVLAWVAAHLDPGGPVSGDLRPAAPVRPDLVVVDRDGVLVVHAADASWQAVRVAPAYARLGGQDPDVREAAAAAAALIARLHARGATVVRVGQAVVDRQSAYLRGGGRRRPVARVQVAQELGLHESTVSRAVAGKTVLWPDGRTGPLADLFGSPGRCARDLLEVLLAQGPASDGALARALTERGHPTARRTVAKYRSELGIPAQR